MPTYRGVVLAAGGSSRYAGPTPKQLVEIGGEPAARRAARTALESRLDRVVVVTGHAADGVRRSLEGLAVETVHNPGWADGQSGSVRAGLRAVGAGAVAVVFMPCDQPFLDARLIDRLIARHGEGDAVIVAPACRGRRGTPVLIDWSLFGELERVTGDAGARQLFDRHPVVELEVYNPALLEDFDSEEALRELLSRRMPSG